MSPRAWRSGALAVVALGAIACRGEKVVWGCVEPLYTMTPTRYTITIGDAAVFQAKVGYTCYDQPRGFTWSVSNPAVATITTSTDSSVVLTAIGVGTALVTATAIADRNVKMAGFVTVVPVAGAGP